MATPMILKALEIDGFMSEPELFAIACLAQSKKLIIEVGSWHGRSTRAMADNMSGKLFAVDHFKGSDEAAHKSAQQDEGNNAYIAFCNNLSDHIASGKVTPLRMSSDGAATLFQSLGMKADLIFIDSGHSYEEVRDTIKNFLPLLAEDGVLCGHDYSPTWPGVMRAVNERFLEGVCLPAQSIWMKK